MGVAQADIVEVVRWACPARTSPPSTAATPSTRSRCASSLPPERQSRDRRPAEAQGARARRQAGAGVRTGRSPETEREKTIYRKDLLPVVYVTGDMGGKLDSPLYGMFDIRSRLKDMELSGRHAAGEWFIRQPADPFDGFASSGTANGRSPTRPSATWALAYAVGLILIYLLVVAQFRSYLVPLIIMAPIPLTIIGVMPGHALLGASSPRPR
jgi:multidrug efflux pump subunit AcrB